MKDAKTNMQNAFNKRLGEEESNHWVDNTPSWVVYFVDDNTPSCLYPSHSRIQKTFFPLIFSVATFLSIFRTAKLIYEIHSTYQMRFPF